MKKNQKPPANAWRKGQSGNPEGRPKGIPNPQARLRKMIDADALIGKLQSAALAGDTQAARTLLERVLPGLRSQREPVALPGLAKAQGMAEQARAVLAAVAAGQVSTDQAAELLAALASAAAAIETSELQERIRALEAQNENA